MQLIQDGESLVCMVMEAFGICREEAEKTIDRARLDGRINDLIITVNFKR